MLDADAQKVLDLINKRGTPSYDAISPLAARAHYRDTSLLGQLPPLEVGSVNEFFIPGPEGEIAVRWYRPHISNPNQELPALVFFHGGGFMLGDLDTHDALCRQFCSEARMAVFSVDYRMGPEHQFPSAHMDAFAALSWIAFHAKELFINPAKIAVGGDSAGGNLAAACALMARDKGSPHVAFQMLIYPGTDFRCVMPSHARFADGYMLTRKLIDYFCRNYVRSDKDRLDCRLSPLLSDDLTHLPPALILTAGYDPLLDEGKEYANRLLSAGNHVEYVCFPGQIHGFITMNKMISQANEAIALCANRLASLWRD